MTYAPRGTARASLGRRTAGVLVVAAALAVPTGAAAAIVPQHGISGVRLGQTEAKVRDILGAPVRAVEGRNDFGRYRELRYRGLTVSLQGGRRVTAVSTGARRERTASGVGVGSTERQVRRGVRGVRCATSFGVRACVVGVQEPGRTVTVFAIEGGRVERVVVGYVID